MNIFIYNCSNTFNYGSMMMGENFISYFNKTSGMKHAYYIETEDEINIDRLKQATAVDEIYAVKMNSLFIGNLTKYDYVSAYLKLRTITTELAHKMDLVVVLGGDDFTEDYGWRGPILNAMKFDVLRRTGLKVVMLGQTMGPYRSFRKTVMVKLLRKIDKIYPRDPITYTYLSGLGLTNISLTDDLAFLPLTRQEDLPGSKEYITYCPSELIYRYAKEGGRQDWLDFNHFIIDKIMEKYPDKKMVLLAHVLKPVHVDDRKITSELFDSVKNKYEGRIILENRELLPFEVRSFIQQSLFVVSSRMHPVISAIQCKIPAIAISYSSKYWGIIGERYGLGNCIIDVRYAGYREMKDKIVSLMDKIDSEYEQIREVMHKGNERAEKSIMNALQEISRLT